MASTLELIRNLLYFLFSYFDSDQSRNRGGSDFLGYFKKMIKTGLFLITSFIKTNDVYY